MIMMKKMIDAPKMVLTVTTPVGEIKTERTGKGEIRKRVLFQTRSMIQTINN